MKECAKQVKERLMREGIYAKKSSTMRQNGSLPVLTRISKQWKKKGQQQNATCILVSNAFGKVYTVP